ncbi:NFACT family protein [Nibrella viscosa]|uniref:NFACT family protein n=1 Tax=Nibrella viscosa TaxID=1084524 RepID=A0ABP8K0K0_9BACT
MHTNYYFLRQLAPALESQIAGLKLMACFSQDRDELVMVFAQARGKINYYRPFYIKATLRPDFSGLLFPEVVQRARTNSVDLFETLYDRPVLGVRAFLNERCLGILLDNKYTLLFKFFGNRPNLLAFTDNTVIELFNQKLVTDNQLVLDALDRPIDQSWEAFVRAGYDYRKLFPTFGKVVNGYLAERIGDKEGKEIGEAEKEAEGREKWAVLQEVLAQLERPRYYLTRIEHRPALSLLPVGEIRREFDEPLEAANRFYIAYNGQNTFEREKGEVLRLFDKRLKRAQAYIDTNLERLINRDENSRNEQIANILMANLHQIPEPPGARSPESVTLHDFYHDRPITIKLKPDLTPQKNAEGYYRKAKNEKIEEEHLQRQLTAREEEITQIQAHRAALGSIESLKELRKYIKQHNLLSDAVGEGPAQLFKEVEHEGFRILIGRNAKNNDLLTQRYAYKDDLWLHARDVSGSHVIIKHQAGKTFPKTVIERAAELAAWYSKRRTDSLCPVIVTPKKFVRKPKGLAEGQVVVDKEDVVMVVPKGES